MTVNPRYFTKTLWCIAQYLSPKKDIFWVRSSFFFFKFWIFYLDQGVANDRSCFRSFCYMFWYDPRAKDSSKVFKRSEKKNQRVNSCHVKIMWNSNFIVHKWNSVQCSHIHSFRCYLWLPLYYYSKDGSLQRTYVFYKNVYWPLTQIMLILIQALL